MREGRCHMPEVSLEVEQEHMKIRNQQKKPAKRSPCRLFEQPTVATEPHFSVAEVSVLWVMSRDTVRSIFRDEPGVIKLDRPATRKKRGYCSLRIPLSVLQRVHATLSK